MELPVQPPIAPMLAKLEHGIPTGDGWLYEPKWDGFRAIAFRDGDEIYIGSRDERPFLRYFPELVDPLRASLPERCVVDGEIVIATESGLEFDSLLLRIHPADSRVKMLAATIPATYVVFDLLAIDDRDVMGAPATERRSLLEPLLAPVGVDAPPASLQVLLTPQTKDDSVGRDWFEGLEALGLDGLIAKRAESLYTPGKRTMVKIKHRRTADCVVGGYRLNKTRDGIGSLLLGVYDDEGDLHYIGHTSSFKAAERRAMLEQLRELETEGAGFGSGRTPGGPSRWTGGKDTNWVALDPVLVCEVAYDHMQGHRFRHAATFIRWRDDKPPEACGFDQVR